MTELISLDAYGVLTEPATLTIQRLLPGPIERIWTYLTDGDLRRKWLAAGRMEPRTGTSFEFVWRNGELSEQSDQRPVGMSEEYRMISRITEYDPPRRISFTWEDSGDVTFELVPEGANVLLTVTHRRLPDRPTLLKVAAGWHMHLDTLVTHANGGKPVPFWPGWRRLKDEYDRRLPA